MRLGFKACQSPPYWTTPMAKRHHRKPFTYLVDYVLVLIFIFAFISLDRTEPYHRHFSLTDTSIQYPMADPERIPLWLLFIISFLGPALIMLIWSLVEPSITGRNTSFRERLWEGHFALLGCLLALGAAITITAIFKNTVGRPRPDFIARCLPNQLTNPISFGLATSDICTQTNHAILKDGFRSFPSGHSSSSWAGEGFLFFFLAGKIRLLDQRGYVYKTFILLVPLMAASLCAISRSMDYRHHAFDVIVGSAIGALMAWLSYRQYYPSLVHTHYAGRAYRFLEDEFERTEGSFLPLHKPKAEEERLNSQEDREMNSHPVMLEDLESR
ncbi:Diacylglycerol pyrophosphate phosphatase 1 [Neolecta irregularis DAH-3]|uniref:Diacylglycerol pyrophosphate phosphatase 1 n=1 Tax=Neolecta irregularis (strain DAH-3) TaxID=1198029 RepID=A0A1U7LP09_NEOID|nr:Diacylglycerol pyrophosphate phosphatase 1 [Neolecta irregularis DAH-3]|eukprot:OLL24384.1 Diacylglycerol pyrophosphate phosphatase 1 [Neolecta irregularis DAH-3]